MNKKMKWLGIFALAASLLLTACGAQPTEAVPTSTPEPTATAEPTATPEATAAEPTEEPTAEPVSQPVEEPSGIVNMAEVTEYLYNREVQGEVLINDDIKDAIDAYYEEWGAKE